jgi:HSP20 family protein
MFALNPWRTREKNGGRAMLRSGEYPVERLRDEFEGLFNRYFGEWPVLFENEFVKGNWGLGVEETDKEFIVHAEAPGFEPKEFEINVSGDRLMLKAEHKEETKEKKEKNGYHYAERHLERALTLPAGTDPAKITATYKSGMLDVHVPKTEAAKPRKIEVKT